MRRALPFALPLALPLLLGFAACGGGDDDTSAGDGAAAIDAAIDAAPVIDPLAGIGSVELVDDGYQFVEGPQWIDALGTLLFSDIPADTIYALTEPDPIRVFRMPSGNSNGLAIATDGALLAAEHGNRRVSITQDVAPDPLAETYQGHRLNSPNDVIARSDGTVYFTDPPYGLASDSDRELDFIGVFRVHAESGGEPVAEWMGPLTARPNGIGLSPDESILYVDDTDAGILRAWDVAADGSLSGERTLSSDVPGADGLAIDTAGNLFVSANDGVRVVAPDGTPWGTITVPEQPANCAFGDADHRTLYITARTGLYRVRLAVAGLPTH